MNSANIISDRIVGMPMLVKSYSTTKRNSNKKIIIGCNHCILLAKLAFGGKKCCLKIEILQ